jgi:RecA-family ATPase
MSKTQDENDKLKAGKLPRSVDDDMVPDSHGLQRMADTFDASFAMVKRGAPKNPLRTGFTDIDFGLKRLGPNEVSILAADSGIGKSTIATQIALHAGACGLGAVYLNLEMNEEMYGLRTVATFMSLSTSKIAAGEANAEELVRLSSGFEKLRVPASRIVMGNSKDHRTIPSVKKLCAAAATALESDGTPVSLVIIDHILQILVNVRNDKDAEGKARADMLKEIAQTHNCHVLALVHVTRDASKGGKLPTKNEIASSMWFDRVTDNLMVFHQKRAEDGTFKDEDAILSCQKARWGTPFAASLQYRGGWFYPYHLSPEKADR